MSKDKVNEGLFGAAKKFSDSFFDGLKSNAVNHALKKAEKRKDIPSNLVNTMKEIDRLSAQLKRDIEKYS
jgi:hypothetical protein